MGPMGMVFEHKKRQHISPWSPKFSQLEPTNEALEAPGKPYLEVGGLTR